MTKLLAMCLCLATYLRSGSTIITPPISTSNSDFVDQNTLSAPFDEEEEFDKISKICLTHSEEEEMAGNIVRYAMARYLTVNLALQAHYAIGSSELRSVLNFAPLGPWINYREYSPEEIENASTIEEYYIRSEPHSILSSLDSKFFFEKNVKSTIAFLDKRIPTIRTIYRKKFNDIRRRPDAKMTIDREEVDLMIQEYRKISQRFNIAFRDLFLQNTQCLLDKGLFYESR